MTISIENLTFGIEAEYVNVRNRELVDYVNNVGSYPINLERYGHSVPTQWKVTTDQTVSTNYDFRTGDGNGGEIVSPILHGSNGIQEAFEMFKVIHQKIDTNINRNCGLHIHIGKNGGWTVDEIKKIYKRWIDFEDQIDEFIPRSRRGNSNRWCQSNKTQQRYNTWMERFSGSRVSDLGYNVNTRYLKLNLASLTRQKTIEFRNHSGTTDPKKITSWIKFLVGFIQASLSSSFDAKSHKRTSKKSFAEVREIAEANGYQLVYQSKKWIITNSSNNFEFTTSEMLDFYDNRTASFEKTGISTGRIRLNDRFNDFVRDYGIVTSETDTGIYFKQEQETIDYLETRKGELS